VDVVALAGSGAAGGLAGGLAALGAALRPGFDVVADAVRLDDALSVSDFVLTGEGKLDATSFSGKVVGGVLARCPERISCAVIAGEVTDDARRALPERVDVASLLERVATTDDAVARAASLLVEAARDLGTRIIARRPG
jgi:glycerate kinase